MRAALGTVFSRIIGIQVCNSRHIVSALGGGLSARIFLINSEVKTALADCRNAYLYEQSFILLTIFNLFTARSVHTCWVQELTQSRDRTMANKLKLACVAAVVLATAASPVFAQTATTTAHRHHYVQRQVYGSRADRGYQANASVAPPAGSTVKPVDNPALTGGGSAGYNVCAGHPAC
jgi:type III secretory pathway component EscS